MQLGAMSHWNSRNHTIRLTGYLFIYFIIMIPLLGNNFLDSKWIAVKLIPVPDFTCFPGWSVLSRGFLLSDILSRAGVPEGWFYWTKTTVRPEKIYSGSILVRIWWKCSLRTCQNFRQLWKLQQLVKLYCFWHLFSPPYQEEHLNSISSRNFFLVESARCYGKALQRSHMKFLICMRIFAFVRESYWHKKEIKKVFDISPISVLGSYTY